ncbi:hypothetical protein Bca4012_018143 [Brassica carinata]
MRIHFQFQPIKLCQRVEEEQTLAISSSFSSLFKDFHRFFFFLFSREDKCFHPLSSHLYSNTPFSSRSTLKLKPSKSLRHDDPHLLNRCNLCNPILQMELYAVDQTH